MLGGGVSNLSSLYRDVPARWTRYTFVGSGRGDRLFTRLVPARWGANSSGVRGAARLAGA